MCPHTTRVAPSTCIDRVNSLGRKGLSTSMTRLTSVASSDEGKGSERFLSDSYAGGQLGSLEERRSGEQNTHRVCQPGRSGAPFILGRGGGGRA